MNKYVRLYFNFTANIYSASDNLFGIFPLCRGNLNVKKAQRKMVLNGE